MSLLACIMFDSVSGLNPILLIGSIFSTFFQYCWLVILVVGIIFSFSYLSESMQTEGLRSSSADIFFNGMIFVLVVYISFIIAHLIGRFYWKNEEKLNWEC